jgi:hypothetical protein
MVHFVGLGVVSCYIIYVCITYTLNCGIEFSHCRSLYELRFNIAGTYETAKLEQPHNENL